MDAEKKRIGYCMSGYGFLRAYCWLCRPGIEAVQVGSSAGENALEQMTERLSNHMEEKHNVLAECFAGECYMK